MSGLTEMGYKVFNSNGSTRKKVGSLRGPCCYTLDSFSLISFPFSPLTAKAVPLPPNAHYANF